MATTKSRSKKSSKGSSQWSRELQEGDIKHPSFDRIWHYMPIDKVKSNRHTHICIKGKVTYHKVEPDGDIHIRLSDNRGNFVVCEVAPTFSLVKPLKPLPTVEKGQTVKIAGIMRWDRQHHWPEIHPIEIMEVVK